MPVVAAKPRRSLKRKLTYAGIFSIVVAVLLIGAYVLLVSTPQIHGYRLDIGAGAYEDLGANKGEYTVENGYPDFSSTVSIHNFGSGVLIDEYWVLTAGHVVLSDGYEEQAGSWQVYIGSDYEKAEAAYDVEEIYIHPGWRADNSDIGLEFGVDIALIKLSNPVTEISPAPWAFATDMDDTMLNSTVYSAGFGDYTNILYDQGGDYYSMRQAWQNTLDRISSELNSTTQYENHDQFLGGFVVYDFDSPDGSVNSLSKAEGLDDLYYYAGKGGSSSVPLELEGTSVPGDSGGPTFANINGTWTVIGVTSHGSTNGYYGDIAFNTRVSANAAWICHIAGSQLDDCI